MAITEKDIEKAVEVMRQGGTVIYPTETCYGIGCDALNTDAVEKVYEIKQRPREKKLTTIVASLEEAEKYCHLSEKEKTVCKAFLPGPLTLIAEKKPDVPDVLNDAFAFRVSSHQICQQLASKLGRPVVATSANLSGEPSNYTVNEIATEVREQVDLVLDGGQLEQQPSSTVLEIRDDSAEIHREGPVSRRDIEQVLNRIRE